MLRSNFFATCHGGKSGREEMQGPQVFEHSDRHAIILRSVIISMDGLHVSICL